MSSKEEELKSCVQCGETYCEEASGAGHCGFHLSASSNRGVAMCCSEREPCRRGVHRSEHHCEYPYARFFERAQKIFGYCDTHEEWASVSLSDPETGVEETACVGQLLRWSTGGAYIADENLMYVKVGLVSHTQRYFFKVYSQQDLDKIGASSSPSASPLIFKTSERASQYASASWSFDEANQQVRGVTLECRVPSFETPSVTRVDFCPFPLSRLSVAVLSRGGILERPNLCPHALLSVSSNVPCYPDLSAASPPRRRTDFTTRDGITPSGTLIITPSPLRFNNRTTGGIDLADFQLSLFNASPGATDVVVLTRLSVSFKLLNDPEWTELSPAQLRLDGEDLPVAVPSLQKLRLAGSLSLPLGHSQRPSFSHSYLARHRPLRVRFTFSDPRNNTASQIVEHVEAIPSLPVSEASESATKLLLFYDDLDLVRRSTLALEACQSGDTLVTGACHLSIEGARKLVATANKTGQTEFPLDLYSSSSSNDIVTSRCFALIDIPCQTVYAIKAQLISFSGIAQQGYLPLRFYGEPDAEPQKGIPATEVAALPIVPASQPIPSVAAIFCSVDNGLDDQEPMVFPPTSQQQVALASPSSTGSSSAQQPADLNRIANQLERLGSLFERTTLALEHLVQAYQP